MFDIQKAQRINVIVTQAGELLTVLSRDPEKRKPRKKPDGSPVTDADIAVSDYIVKELGHLGHLVVSEEDLPDNPPQAGDTYFLVDPLDGTKYYANFEDEFAVCVGLIEQGRPVYGSIYSPVEGVLYWAAEGLGAFRGEDRINHSGPGESLVVYSSGFHKKPERSWVIEALNIKDIREKGSALKFCDIAKGEVDLYLRFGPTSEWDTAGAQILLEEAGCVLLEAKTGQPIVYGKAGYLNRGIIACHKSLEGKVVKLVQEHLGKKK